MCVHTTPAYTMSPGCPADRLAKFGEYCEFLRIIVFCTTCMANSVYSGAGAFNTAAAGASALAAHSH
jgi:hypothetical protein